MQLKEWLASRKHGAGAGIADAVSEIVDRPISRQLLRAYVIGHTTPPEDVCNAISYLTSGQVVSEDWIALARSVGRTNMSPSGRPLRPRDKVTQRDVMKRPFFKKKAAKKARKKKKKRRTSTTHTRKQRD